MGLYTAEINILIMSIFIIIGVDCKKVGMQESLCVLRRCTRTAVPL